MTATIGLPALVLPKCNLCEKSDSPCVDVHNDHQRVLTVADIARLPSWHVRTILSRVCSRCLLLIGSLTDSSNLLRLRCTQALKTSKAANNTQPAIDVGNCLTLLQNLTPSPDNITNNIAEPLQANANSKCPTLEQPVNTIPTDLATTAKTSSILTENSQKSQSSICQQLDLFDIHHEVDISPLATESGGTHYASSKTAEHECLYCNLTFRRRRDYKKHIRRCYAAKIRRCKSSLSRRRSTYEADDAASAVSLDPSTNNICELNAGHAIYSDESPQKLRSLLESQQFKCEICGHLSMAKSLFDNHQFECLATFAAKREKEFGRPARRNTRSYSTYISKVLVEKGQEITNDFEAANKKTEAQLKTPKANAKKELVCPQCSRVYKKANFYEKHCSKCIADLPSQSDKENRFEETQPAPILCPHCPRSFHKPRQLNGHLRTHAWRFHCDVCDQSFKTQKHNDVHREQGECLVTAKGTTGGTCLLPARRMTRTFTRYFSEKELQLKDNTDTEDIAVPCQKYKQEKEIPSHKLASCASEAAKINATRLEENFESIEESNISLASNTVAYSTISSYFRKNGIACQKSQGEYDVDMSDVAEGADDDPSTADSIHFRRISFTNSWLEKHTNPMKNDDIPNLYKYLKPLERLRHDVHTKAIRCYEPNCDYLTTNLNNLMFHDYIYHFKKPRYTCRKCGDCFTSRVFLDYHVDVQDTDNVYTCNKCEHNFSSTRELHHHLLQHQKMSEKKFICLACNLTFLNGNDLWEHCRLTGHDCRKTSVLIQMDRSRTYHYEQMPGNEIHTTRSYGKSYCVQYITIPKVPLRRTNSKFYSRWSHRNERIGRVEFPNTLKANCAQRRI